MNQAYGIGRILVMDDDKLVRHTIGSMLKEIGYEVYFAKDGNEAIDLYKQWKESQRPFEAVLMDLTIPGGMGGKETIKKLLKIDPAVKVIISSGYFDDDMMKDFRKYGFRDIIPKPYRIKTLSEILHNVIVG